MAEKKPSDRPWRPPTPFVDCHTPARPYLAKARCGEDRDCISSDLLQVTPFFEMVCSARPWLAKHPTRTVEIWSEDNKRRLIRLKGTHLGGVFLSGCPGSEAYRPAPGSAAAPDVFTIDVPGIQDIIKVKDWESPRLRFERWQRFQSRRSSIPDFLQWIPPLLTKLDNAQDMLFTGLALAIPLIRRLPLRFLPGIGWALAANDLLNLFT